MDEERGPSRRRPRRLLAAGAIVGGVVAGGLGMAVAQTATTSPPSTTTVPGGAAPQRPGFAGELRHGHGHGPGGFGFGRGGAIHGEFVTPDGTGFRTVATQLGEVTKVSSDSITVKSADGFSRTYAVGDQTLVNAGRDGIGDVKDGDTVRVLAVVDGKTATATDIRDATRLGAIRDHWRPAPAPAAPDGGMVTPSSSA